MESDVSVISSVIYAGLELLLFSQLSGNLRRRLKLKMDQGRPRYEGQCCRFRHDDWSFVYHYDSMEGYCLTAHLHLQTARSRRTLMAAKPSGL